jgi:acetylglutamate kinase
VIRVIKIGGRAQGDPRLSSLVAGAVHAPASLPSRRGTASDQLCLVHGGGDEVSALQRRLGLAPRFVGGRRVTSDEDLAVVRMVLSGTTNKRLVAQLIGAGVNAVGVSGEDGNLLRATPLDVATLGRVGGAVEVDPRLVQVLCGAGFVPVVSPLAREADAEGSALNVNGDDAAAALAVALGAGELLLVVDVDGVLASGEVIAELDNARAHVLIASGEASGGMAAKLQAAERAVQGVPAVRIAGIEAIHNPMAGTRIVPTHSSV